MVAPAKDYSKWVKLASIASLSVAGLLIAIKLYAWGVTGAASLMAALTDSLLDAVASGMNFFVLRFALIPADDNHRFGHGKAESLAGLGQAAFISGSSVLLIFHAINRLYQPVPIAYPEIGIWVSVIAIGLTLALLVFQRLVIAKTGSVAIKADALHYKGDLLLNASVILAIVLSMQGVQYVDSITAILIALFLLYSAWSIALESGNSLMDRELTIEDQQVILRLAKSHPQVRGVHQLRTRQGGHTKFIQMHLSLDDELSLFAAHEIADEVELSIKQHFDNADVLIHQDPVSLGGND